MSLKAEWELAWNNDPQCVVLRLTALASPESLRKCRFLGPTPKLIQSYWIRNSGSGSSNLWFNKPSRWLWWTLKFENPWSERGDHVVLAKSFDFSCPTSSSPCCFTMNSDVSPFTLSRAKGTGHEALSESENLSFVPACAHCIFRSAMLSSLELPQNASGQGRSGPNDMKTSMSMNIHLDKLGKIRPLSSVVDKNTNSGVRICKGLSLIMLGNLRQIIEPLCA